MQQVPFMEIRRRFNQQGMDFPTTLRRDYGDSVYGEMPILPRMVFLFHPDHVHELLVNLNDKIDKPGLITAVLSSSFGNGIFTSGGDLWKRQRRLMQPVFHHARIGKFADQIVTQAQSALAGWNDDDMRVIDAEMEALTLTLVVNALFSTNVASEAAEIGQAMHDLGQAIAAQGANLWMTFMPDWIPLPIMQGKRRGVATINRIIYRMVAERRAAGEAASPNDLLSSLVFTQDAETGEKMADGQVRDELMTLFIAGHETTARLLGWVWVLLAQHPEIEAKLHAELDAVLAGKPPTLADLPQLTYPNLIIKETLRLYPPAWFLFRQNHELLTIGGENIVRNSIIFFFPAGLHRDERWYNQPERFWPERWENDFEKTLPRGAYIPFGMGPHICIGNGFAMMEAQLLLALIAQRFRLELCSEARPTRATGTLGFERPVQMRLHARQLINND